MDNIFMNSENSKTSDPFRLLHNLSLKKIYKGVINMLVYQILACTIHGKSRTTTFRFSKKSKII